MLRGTRPAARVLIGGSDLTALWKDRLVSVRIEEAEGDGESDRVDLELDNRGQRVPIPNTGETIRVELGWLDAPPLRVMGDYSIDEIGVHGPPLTVRIGAKGARFARSALSDPRTHAWHDTTLGSVVSSIASRHGLRAIAHESIAGLRVPHLDQQGESDLALLQRIARRYDLTLRVDAETITLRPHAGELAPSNDPSRARGSAPSLITISAREITRYEWERSDRGDVAESGAVVTEFVDPDTGQVVRVERGPGAGRAGARRARARHTAQDREDAERIADARLRQLARSTASLTLTLPGRPDIVCGARLHLTDIGEPIGGEWSVERVEHRLDAKGLITTLECVVPGAGRVGAKASGAPLIEYV